MSACCFSNLNTHVQIHTDVERAYVQFLLTFVGFSAWKHRFGNFVLQD